MQTIENVTVADIASKSLVAVRVFEELGIDYCCGGKRTLADACRSKGYDPAEVRKELDAAVNQSPEPARDWTAAPLRELIDHIVGTHHAYLKRELPAIAERIEKVSQRHSETLPGLPEVFGRLRAEMELHLRKEEAVLFPAIVAGAFGLDLVIGMMEAEHESAGDALARIREITKDYHVPDHACVTYRALMTGLEEMEKDLHLHVHLENNVLFPKALR